jgi:hypothetical protein
MGKFQKLKKKKRLEKREKIIILPDLLKTVKNGQFVPYEE